MKKAFICYSSQDKPFAYDLAINLRRCGIKVWFDSWEIKVGDSLHDKISQGLDSSDYLIAVISTFSIKSDWVKRELNSALATELARKVKKVLPVVLDIDRNDLPPFLQDRKFADFRLDPTAAFRDLYEAINGHRNETIAFVSRNILLPVDRIVKGLDKYAKYALEMFVVSADNPEGIGFVEESTPTRSVYEAEQDLQRTVSGFATLNAYGVITTVIDVWKYEGTIKYYRCAAQLTKIGYAVAQEIGIEEIKAIRLDLLPYHIEEEHGLSYSPATTY